MSEASRPAQEKPPLGLLGRMELERENDALKCELAELKRKASQLAAVHEVGKLLASDLELNQVLEHVVREAVTLAHAEESWIALLDEQTGELYEIAQIGLEKQFAGGFKVKTENSVVGSVIQTGKPQRLTSQDRILKVTTGYMLNSILAVPLILKDQAIGVLSVGNRVPDRPFTEDDESLLSVLADYAAIAIQNARLVKVLRNQAHVLSTLHRTGHSMLSALALDKVLEQIAQSALQVLGADLVILYEYDKTKGDVVMPPTIEGEARGPARLRNRGPTHRSSSVFEIIRRGMPFYASNAKVDWIKAGLVQPQQTAGETFVIREEIASSAAVPLFARNEIVGVVFVNYRTFHPFGDEAKETIGIFADQAAIAIQNAELVRDRDRKIAGMTSLLEISHAMTTSPTDPQEVLRRTVENTQKVIGSDYAVFFPYDGRTAGFQSDRIATSGVPDYLIRTIRKPRSYGTTEEIAKKGQVVVTDVRDIEKSPFIGRDAESFVVRANVQSLVGIRLRVGQELMGVLYADFCAPRQFSEDEIQTLQLFANQAAIAIHTARLFEATQRHVKELRALNEISQAISSSATLEIDEILQGVYHQTANLMDVCNFYIALYASENKRVSFRLVIEHGERQVLGQGDWADRAAGNGLTEYVIRSGVPLLIPSAVPEWLRANGVDVIGRLAKAWLGVPMIARDRVLGVIGIQSYDTENAYDENHKNLLQTIASQTAIALENAWLLQKERLGREQLEALHQTSLDITGQLDLTPLLQAIVQRAATLLHAPGGGLLLREGDKPEVVMRVTHGLDVILGMEFKFGEGMVGAVAQSGTHLIVDDYHSWEGRDRRFDEEPYKNLFRALVQVPLKWQDEVIGVLSISDDAPGRTFNSNDVQLLEQFASQAAIAFQNATLFNKKVKELEALQRADIALLSTMDLKVTLKTILDQLGALIKCECIIIRLWDEEKQELILEESQGDHPGRIPVSRKRGIGITGRAAEQRTKIIVPDFQRDPNYPYWEKTAQDPEEKKYLCWIRSEVAVPLIAKDKLVGVLAALSSKPNGFAKSDIELMDVFAGRAAIALHNALLIRQNRQHTVFVAHQLKGPLQAIRGDVDRQLSYIGRNYSNDEQLNRLHSRIGEHFGRLKKDLDNFAFLTRDDLGVGHKFVINAQPIIYVIEEVAAQFKETAYARGIEIRIDGSVRDLPRLHIDRENMFTVFTNLIDNAVKYSHSIKSIDIKGERRGHRVIIRVEDFGLGVMPDDADRLFELYTQGRLKDEKRFVQGTGIGLWVAKKIVSAHGGDIKVWSELFEHPELTSSLPDVIDRGFLTIFSVELPTRKI